MVNINVLLSCKSRIVNSIKNQLILYVLNLIDVIDFARIILLQKISPDLIALKELHSLHLFTCSNPANGIQLYAQLNFDFSNKNHS